MAAPKKYSDELRERGKDRRVGAAVGLAGAGTVTGQVQGA